MFLFVILISYTEGYWVIEFEGEVLFLADVPPPGEVRDEGQLLINIPELLGSLVLLGDTSAGWMFAGTLVA